jgi:VanZ family protein
MHLIVTLIIFAGLAAILVWVADWTARPQTARPQTALDILDQRLARGEIDRAEYNEKRNLIGQDSTFWTDMPAGHELDMVPRLRIVAQFAAWTLATTIVVLSVVPAHLRPETGLPQGLEHFAIWCMTGIAFGLGYKLKPFLLATVLVFFSGAVEIAQLFVPGRHARVTDFIIDALACIIGLLMASVTSAGSRVPRKIH